MLYLTLSLLKLEPLKHLNSGELKQLKESGNTFLVVFGTKDCPMCMSLLEDFPKAVFGVNFQIEAYFYDCDEFKDTCQIGYGLYEHPKVLIFNSLKQKRYYIYDDLDYDPKAIVEWSLLIQKKPFTLFNSSQQLQQIKEDEFVLILLSADKVDGRVYRAVRAQLQQKFYVLNNFGFGKFGELKGTQFDGLLEQKNSNVIHCRNKQCKRYDGLLQDVEKFGKFLRDEL